MACLTAAEIDSLARGDIPPESADRLREHATSCHSCRERLLACESNEEVLDELKRLPSHWFESGVSDASSNLSAGAISTARRRLMSPGELLPEEFAGYRIIERIHQGGQGLVYRALQAGTGREVAIKVLREGPFADQGARSRFEREVRLLASLRHPHIVTVHHSGTVGGNCYFVMDYVAGERLDVYTARDGRPIRPVVELFAKICEAINAAHLRGIIHRDLKPGNVLIDQDGQPRILDFGLAKEATARVEDAFDAQSMTATGQFLGSLPWSSPEQAEGHPMQVDTRTDVYSLGVMFYHALTGRFPYDVTGSMRAILERIVHADPVRPRSCRSEIDDELETILLKCLSKDRDRRYQTAGELAQDLRLYLAGEPIQAKHDSPLYVLRKTLRRYRIPVTVAASFALLVLASTVSLAFLYRSARSSAAIAELRRVAAIAAQAQAADSEQRAVSEKQNAEKVSYRALITLGRRGITEHAYGPARKFLEACPPSCRNWEWGWLHRLTSLSQMNVEAHGSDVLSATFSPDGRLFATAGKDSDVKIWDATSGALLRTLLGHTMSANAVVFSPDGRLLATCDDHHYVGVWDVQTGQRLLWFEASGSAVRTIAFDPQGTSLATGSGSYWGDTARDYAVKLWNVADGRQLAEFCDFESAVYSVAFHPGGKWLAAGTEDGDVRIIDLLTGHSWALHEPIPIAVWSLAFSPDGRWLAEAFGQGHTRHLDKFDNRARVWDWQAQELVCTLEHGRLVRDSNVLSPQSSVYCARFSQDGRRLITAGADRMARVWALPAGKEIARFPGHADKVMSAGFNPSGDRVITAGADGTVKIWASAGPDPVVTLSHEASVRAVAFNPDGSRLAVALNSGQVVLWQGDGSAILAQRQAHTGQICSVQFSPDGSRLVTASQDGTVRLFDASTLEETRVIQEPGGGGLTYAAFSPDGRKLAVASGKESIQILDSDSEQLLRTLHTDSQCICSFAYGHVGSQLAVANDSGTQVWDGDTGALIRKLPEPRASAVYSVAFGPDDRLLASAGTGGVCSLWNLETMQQLLALQSQSRAVRALAFSPDGTRLILGGEDQALTICETQTGIELLSLTEPASAIYCAAFSPDGQTIAAGCWDGRVLLWRALAE